MRENGELERIDQKLEELLRINKALYEEERADGSILSMAILGSE